MQKPNHFKEKDFLVSEEVPELVADLAAELCIDSDHVSISIDRFTELVKAECELELIKKLWHGIESYKFDCVLTALFGSRDKKNEDE